MGLPCYTFKIYTSILVPCAGLSIYCFTLLDGNSSKQFCKLNLDLKQKVIFLKILVNVLGKSMVCMQYMRKALTNTVWFLILVL